MPEGSGGPPGFFDASGALDQRGRPSDEDHFDRVKLREVLVLGHHRGAVSERSCRNPCVMATKFSAFAKRGVSKSREQAARLGINRKKREGGTDPGKGCEPRGTGLAVYSTKHPKFQLGRSDHGYPDLVGQRAQFTARLLSDKNRSVSDGAGHRSSITSSRTAAMSLSNPGSAGDSVTIRRNSPEDTHGLLVN